MAKFPFRIFVVSLVVLLAFASGLTAQAAEAGPWDKAYDGVMSVYSAFAKLVKGIILIGGLVVLGEIIIKITSGDRESARKLLWWLMGLAIGFILLEILTKMSFA